MCDGILSECYESQKVTLETIATVVHPNDVILQLLITVMPLNTRQRLLDLLSTPAQDAESPLASDAVYQKALEIVSGICSRSTYT